MNENENELPCSEVTKGEEYIDDFRQYLLKKIKGKDQNTTSLVSRLIPKTKSSLSSPYVLNDIYHHEKSSSNPKDFSNISKTSSQKIENEYSEDLIGRVKNIWKKVQKKYKLIKSKKKEKFENYMKPFENLESFIDSKPFIEKINITNQQNIDYLIKMKEIREEIRLNHNEQDRETNLNDNYQGLFQEKNDLLDCVKNRIHTKKEKVTLNKATEKEYFENFIKDHVIENHLIDYLMNIDVSNINDKQDINNQYVPSSDEIMMKDLKNYLHQVKTEENQLEEDVSSSLMLDIERKLKSELMLIKGTKFKSDLVKGIYLDKYKEQSKKLNLFLKRVAKNIFKKKAKKIDKALEEANQKTKEGMKKIENLKKFTNYILEKKIPRDNLKQITKTRVTGITKENDEKSPIKTQNNKYNIDTTDYSFFLTSETSQRLQNISHAKSKLDFSKNSESKSFPRSVSLPKIKLSKFPDFSERSVFNNKEENSSYKKKLKTLVKNIEYLEKNKEFLDLSKKTLNLKSNIDKSMNEKYQPQQLGSLKYLSTKGLSIDYTKAQIKKIDLKSLKYLY